MIASTRHAPRTASAGVIAAMALSLLLAPVATAKIVINKSIAGVSIDDSLQRVHRVLGAPLNVERMTAFNGLKTRTDVYRGLRVTTADGVVIQVATTRRGERAPGPVRVGVGLAQLRQRLRARGFPLRCFSYQGSTTCSIADYPPAGPAGAAQTDFVIRHDQVAEISVGRVID